jgi:hypothetical protein
MAKMIANFADFTNIELSDGSTAPTFTGNESIVAYAQEPVNRLAEAGILISFNGKFNPKNSVTRTEAAKALVQFLNLN